jgi:CheY-like chemotaxis protein
MRTPVKACNGRFSEETLQALLKNVDRAQWLPHKCQQCEQLVGAKLEKGLWIPEPHWPSVIARRTSGSTVQQRREKTARQIALAGETAAPPSRSQHNGATSGQAAVVAEAWNEILDPAAIPELTKAPVALPPVPLRVFVVDDEFNIASTLGLILRHHGFDATAFTGPLEALEAVEAHAPDLLISDIAMPQLSGVELAIRVREIAQDCKILLFSGEASSAGLVEAARVRGHRFEMLSRPLHPAELLKRIQRMAEESGLSVADSN